MGARVEINGTTYNGLTAWQAASMESGSTTATPPTATATADFNTADANLETLPGWTNIAGAAGALAIRTNDLAAVSTTQTTYTWVDVPVFDRYMSWTTRGAGTSGPVVAAAVADASNWFGVRWSSTVYQNQINNAGSFTQPTSTSGITPTAGDSVVHMFYAHTDPSTGTVTYRTSLFINGVQGWFSQPVTLPASVQTELTAGLVARSATQNPWLDNLSVGRLRAA